MAFDLQIENFKCFANQSFAFESLNVLCGANGAGKSTIMQAIQLFDASREAYGRNAAYVSLNTHAGLSLGAASDIAHRTTTGEFTGGPTKISISNSSQHECVTLISGNLEENENYLSVAHAYDVGNPLRKKFVFLSAERIGPRLAQGELSDLPIDQLTVGENGEFAAEVLVRLDRKKLGLDDVLYPSDERLEPAIPFFGKNVEQWMKRITGIGGLRASGDVSRGRPRVEILGAGKYDDWVIASNFGFGVSYVLPVVVACLMADQDTTLLIDSPEAHLHPSAQTRLADFLCRVAASGVCIVVETHSDHIVDGIRLAVASKASPVLATGVKFFQVATRENSAEAEVVPIQVTDRGALSSWPKGFFDQQAANLRAIALSARSA
ncbi:MAG: DUF3696 domain-containing protein [Rhodocyclaceae bacterium]|nr:DUF3696 domain-containing protein [Rhodocyclaceae bacterium]MCA3019990.1 DUF3696 domain-containing protein [Rhodocyclaceae bacterium]MCA3021040.1 DUF3696 domain-containing protein [Rhodocyclaceae bacterium]MCA3025380.1 DUF3696 domain-containing protein [Rhodocyclaceae bacterium]MCA3038245.1 DUF3696 domain-containing protein [Rhodocyclaceae bacterium]